MQVNLLPRKCFYTAPIAWFFRPALPARLSLLAAMKYMSVFLKDMMPKMGSWEREKSMNHLTSLLLSGHGGGRSVSSSLFANPALSSLLVVVVIVGFIIMKQLTNRPISRRDILVPVLGGVLLAYSYVQHADALSAALVLGGALIGIATGLASGQLRKIWRDPQTGLIHQYGNWRSVLVTLGLIALRFLLSFALHTSGMTANTPALNDALTAMALGSYLGQMLNLGLRVLALNNWDLSSLQALPGKGDPRTPTQNRALFRRFR